ncbi:MAG: HNH endonuclease signature motif containing protein [Pyrinomonadaceae bacterium]
MRRTKITTEKVNSFIEMYVKQHLSTTEIALHCGVSSRTVSKHLKLNNIILRSIAEGNSIKWTNEAFRNNQVQKRLGKPSGAQGKRWTYDRVIKRPNLQGSKSHFWKGGVTGISRQIRNSVEYKQWRKQVLRRDSFTCVQCRRPRTKGHRYIIHVDHIIPLSEIIKRDEIKTLEDALQCSLVMDINNGRTLCIDCHRQTDSWLNNGLNKKNR